MSDKLVKMDELRIAGRSYVVRYLESTTGRGALRYSSELALGPTDRIILDGSSLMALESKIARVMPAMLQSRLIAG
jgi:hypothetical protein